ncbi:MAG TPA: hypothetical protein VK680_10465 [Solirubrobacteraceae bacterium]|jgi:hypothetical protein|nr:hypothetical protein [Solirubrobacteraceae bacterium]
MSTHGSNGSRPSAAAQPAAGSADDNRHAQTATGADAGVGGVVLPAGGLPVPSGSMSELRRRRLELAERVAALTWDLGGLAYEMAIRDHYRLDVLARKASELQEVDAQLGEVQRLLATAEAGVHGQCRSCGAVHSRGAAYCWHCGAPLMQEARPSVLHSQQPA